MVGDRFPIVDASAWSLVRSEQLGTKEKVWLEDPKGGAWLFKQVRGDGGQTRGEDWAEKLAAEAAMALGLPAARIELATRPFAQGSSRGVLSRYMLAERHSLTHGNELLAARSIGYPQSATGEVPGYTVSACFEALDGFAVPPGVAVPTHRADARFLFVGYLVLDALVANTDRHHQNWAVGQAPDSPAYLAPTFDHGSSLGFQESDKRKQWLLDRDGVARWTARAKSKFEGKPHPVEVALDALAQLPRLQAAEWRRRLVSYNLDWWRTTLERVPEERMSAVARDFAYHIVRLNREALVDVC